MKATEAKLDPYQKTDSRDLADMLCGLFGDRGIPYSRREKTSRVPLTTDAPEDDYGWTDQTMYYIDAPAAVVAKLRAAKTANPQAAAAWETDPSRLRDIYAAALDA